MVMQEQSKRLSEPLRWTRGGKLAVLSACVVLLAALATVAVLASTSGSRPAGCIEVTFPSTLGAAVIHPCGARASELCANPSENPAVAAHDALRDACRQAGLRYGPAAAGG
jgi:hypothetical protein